MNIVNIRNIVFVLGVVVLLSIICLSCNKSLNKENIDESTTIDINSNLGTSVEKSDLNSGEGSADSVPVIEVDKYNKDYETVEFPVEFNGNILELIKPVRTGEEAKTVAIAIIEELHKQGRWIDYTLVSVLHSMEDNVWRFEYSLNQSDVPVDELVDCSCAYVVIDGNEGVIIAAWVVE